MGNLGGLLRYPIDQIPFVFLSLLLAFTLHEFAHAYTADKFGDPTPRAMGRVTLHPRAHLDFLGTVLIFLVGFGWAKPVLVNPGHFKYRRLMGITVSFAGPLANLLLAFIGVLFYYLAYYFHWYEAMSPGAFRALTLFLNIMISLNALLFIFNLLPLPPLDGYRILQDFLPLRARLKLQQYEQWAVYLFLLFVFLPPLYNFVLGPIFSLSDPILNAFFHLCKAIFGKDIVDLILEKSRSGV